MARPQTKFELTEYGKKYCTGSFFFTYWNGSGTTWDELLTAEEALNHLIEKGWPFSITAELKDQKHGNKTFAHLLTRWDEKEEIHWHTIAQLQGRHIIQEVQI